MKLIFGSLKQVVFTEIEGVELDWAHFWVQYSLLLQYEMLEKLVMFLRPKLTVSTVWNIGETGDIYKLLLKSWQDVLGLIKSVHICVLVTKMSF